MVDALAFAYNATLFVISNIIVIITLMLMMMIKLDDSKQLDWR